jgi:hypothetical protein
VCARVSHKKSLIYKGKSHYSLQARANTVRPYKFRGRAVKPRFIKVKRAAKYINSTAPQKKY